MLVRVGRCLATQMRVEWWVVCDWRSSQRVVAWKWLLWMDVWVLWLWRTVWSTASNAVWFPAIGEANDGVGVWKASRKCEREREHDSQQIRLAYRERASMLLLLLPPAVSLPTYCGAGEEEEKKAMMLLCFFTAYSVLTHLIICRDIHA